MKDKSEISEKEIDGILSLLMFRAIVMALIKRDAVNAKDICDLLRRSKDHFGEEVDANLDIYIEQIRNWEKLARPKRKLG